MSETHRRLPVLQCCARCYESRINNLVAYLLFSALLTWMLLDCCCHLSFHFFSLEIALTVWLKGRKMGPETELNIHIRPSSR